MIEEKPLDVIYPTEGGLECPYPFYEALHDVGVYQVPGTSDFLVSRYEDVVWVSRHPELFSSKKGFMYREDPDLARIAARGYPPTPTVVDNDDPGHAAYRELIFRTIAPRRLASYEPLITSTVDGLIDAFADRGEVEFVSEFANELPMLMFAEILDLPQSSIPDLRRWVDDWVRLLSKFVSKERAMQLQESVVEFELFLGGILEERRRSPGDDALSELVQSSLDPEFPLEMAQLVALAKIFITAGTETTAMMLANAMALLVQHPGQMELVAEDLNRIPAMLEEALRVEPPTHWNHRVCLEDTTVGGVSIPAGSRVLIVYGAANRDEQQFADAERFDLERPNARRHLGFGTGIHSCVGAPLARLEGRIAFERLFTRAANWRLAHPELPLEYRSSPIMRGLTELPLAFDARR